MGDIALLALGAIVVNNFVLTQFLGLCPFVGASRHTGDAISMGLATAFVLTVGAGAGHLVHHHVLVPLGLEYLRIVVFMVIIAALVQFTEIAIRHASPLLHQVLGIYLPLITTNCAVLAVVLLALDDGLSFLETLVFAVGAAAGFALVMALFAALRERLIEERIPLAFRGAPIVLITAGILSLAFMGFGGIG